MVRIEVEKILDQILIYVVSMCKLGKLMLVCVPSK